MAKTLKEYPITTASARSKLEAGEYARRLDADAAIWYRRGKRGGVWFARWRNHYDGAAYKQAPVGPANDVNDKPTDGLLTYLQAEALARQIVTKARAEAKSAADGPALTVRLAVDAYIAARDARDIRRAGRTVRSDAARRLGRHVLSAPLADVKLHALKESDLTGWRTGLPGTLKPTAVQRTINDLKAALNACYDANRAKLDPGLRDTIKHGLKAETVDDDAGVQIARSNQILTDAQVGAIIAAARAVDEDVYRLVVVLAATGARFSQVMRMTVADVQRDKGRLMIPSSRKGKGKSGSIPVPVGKDVLDALLPATIGRGNDEPLLMRERYERVPGKIEWRSAGRVAWWTASELTGPSGAWKDIKAKADMPTVIPYALRHSSIVRGIKANLPIRLVAALHDTSVAMIERHYGRWIADGLEDLAAAAVVPLVPAEGNNVVPMARG
ncbi:integrase [Mesorhizobium sp. M2D.F.Ca.ET.171.01.1.1]|uniref:tyrosine-type recombinase/integrase n=1 Tax=unclassified Mesorhizobium TaxID=325217 RepID=UPI0010925BAB|nr:MULTISPECIES: tyrosine-type recombinase/integrase [unclassified Mesorhizobium]TGS94792.1 integrase [Mesorhizobium sp. M2D.F.Ca.ET.178.01.1.1]TGT10574.1 integrase [Mesorhizobium sp. M2D.F.Ca.ET.171.01.1.1]